MPYKERIIELIETKVCFLLTGNSMEIFGKEIQKEDGTSVQGLSIINTIAKQDMFHRLNSIILGNFDTMPIVRVQKPIYPKLWR